MRIWAPDYNPFIMGGDVNAPMCTEVPVGEKIDLGQGYFGYLLCAPDGTTVVAEASTGAFVGPDIQTVRTDIAEGDPEVMRSQVSHAEVMSRTARPLDPEEFWRKWLKRQIREA